MRRTLSVIIVITALSITACRPPAEAGSSAVAPGTTFTSSELTRLGAANAWDALHRAGLHLALHESATGTPQGIERTRGDGAGTRADAESTHLSRVSRANQTGAVVIIDGVPTWDVSVLRDIPVAMIETMTVVHKRGDMPALVPGQRQASAVITLTTRRAKY